MYQLGWRVPELVDLPPHLQDLVNDAVDDLDDVKCTNFVQFFTAMLICFQVFPTRWQLLKWRRGVIAPGMPHLPCNEERWGHLVLCRVSLLKMLTPYSWEGIQKDWALGDKFL